MLSADGEHDLDVVAINAASASLMCSNIPWAGPVAAARVILDADGHLHANPSLKEQEGAALQLLVAVTADAVVMLEGGAVSAQRNERGVALLPGPVSL